MKNVEGFALNNRVPPLETGRNVAFSADSIRDRSCQNLATCYRLNGGNLLALALGAFNQQLAIIIVWTATRRAHYKFQVALPAPSHFLSLINRIPLPVSPHGLLPQHC